MKRRVQYEIDFLLVFRAADALLLFQGGAISVMRAIRAGLKSGVKCIIIKNRYIKIKIMHLIQREILSYCFPLREAHQMPFYSIQCALSAMLVRENVP